jgi:hypothetical protein
VRRPAAVSLWMAAILLAAGCAAKPQPSDPGASGPLVSASASPSDNEPPVITESALPTDSSTDVENPSDPVRPSSSAGAPPRSTEGLAGCALPYLRVTVRPGPARSSHAGYVITFTNTGQIACTLTGYPAVTVLNSSGQQVVRATPTSKGYLGGHGRPGTVLIASGEPASALLEGEIIDINGNRCGREPGLQITPPNSTLPARVPVSTTICGGVQIHPVVAGKSG